MHDDIVLAKLLRQDHDSRRWCLGHRPTWLGIFVLPGLGNATHGPRRDGHAQHRRVGPHGPVTGLRNVGGDDGRHDGSVGHPHAASLCHDQLQPARAGKRQQLVVGPMTSRGFRVDQRSNRPRMSASSAAASLRSSKK
jgi:hypothetical protein